MARNQNQKASPAEIQQHLSGIDYPVDKQQLIKHARQENAPDDVMSVLQRIPDGEYDSPIAVSKAVGEVE